MNSMFSMQCYLAILILELDDPSLYHIFGEAFWMPLVG